MIAGTTEPTVPRDFWKLPDEWQWISLNEVAPRDSQTAQPSDTPRQMVTYLGLEHVEQGQGTEAEYQNILGQEIKSTCIVFNTSHVLYGKLRPYLNKVVLPDRNGFGSTEWVPFRPDQEKLERKYLAWFLRSPGFVAYASKNVTGARMPRARMDVVLEAPVPVPFPSNPKKSLDVQRRIVARIEALLAEVRSSRELLDEMRRDCDRLLAVSLSEVFSKLEPVANIVPLEEVATAFNGRASGSGISTVRVFKTRHVYPHTLRLHDPSYAKPEQASSLPAERFLRLGDVLMANIAEGTLGRVSYVEKSEASWTVDTQIMILRSKDENELLGKWLYYYLWSERGQQEILSRRTGIAFADKRGQTHIYPKNVVEIPVPKPPINAQRQAITYLDTILREAERMTDLMEQDTKTLNLLEQSILERAFRGEL